MKKGWSNIVKLYGSVTEVDLYVGMLMEEPVPGSKVNSRVNNMGTNCRIQLGPTSICSVVDQFVALKTGDRHWYVLEQPTYIFNAFLGLKTRTCSRLISFKQLKI